MIAIARYVAHKVDLSTYLVTVNAVEDNGFDVNIIPHTAEWTTLGLLKAGDPVNLEVDLLARYAERLLAGDADDNASVSRETLAKAGFAD